MGNWWGIVCGAAVGGGWDVSRELKGFIRGIGIPGGDGIGRSLEFEV